MKIPTKSTYFPPDIVTPSQMFEHLMVIVTNILCKVGAPIFNENFTPINKKLILNLFILFLTTCLEIYNISRFIQKELVRAIISIIGFTGCFQGLGKMYTFVNRRNQVIFLKDLSVKFFKKPHTQNAFSIYEKRLMQATHFIFFLSILFVFCFILFGLYPIIFKIFLNIDTVFLELEIPFIDWKNSLIGYVANLFYGYYIVICFILASIGSTFLIICFLATAITHYDILKDLLKELNEITIQNNDENKNEKIKKLLKSITDIHVDLLNFMNIFANLFKFYYFMEIDGLFIQMIISLYAISTFNFLPGYMIIIAATFQIFMPCFFATFIIIKAEEFNESINNVSWYMMTTKDQKTLMMILKASQKEKTLSTGIVELNISTFVEMYKAIYSYWMILQNLN
ncbi:hypothetical protein PVAND_013471 [Polypedilum vanderplanki]|uniref:Odorant receptor n=1 Tax=Polypedilum vanderplanki TaxID=319348 RepID=A0A9J6CPT3_POLVA|nr:hypothetical protein PVAND_013471 [Polypedilum vanderplanki]